jgi:hypothetical protein
MIRVTKVMTFTEELHLSMAITVSSRRKFMNGSIVQRKNDGYVYFARPGRPTSEEDI